MRAVCGVRRFAGFFSIHAHPAGTRRLMPHRSRLTLDSRDYTHGVVPTDSVLPETECRERKKEMEEDDLEDLFTGESNGSEPVRLVKLPTVRRVKPAGNAAAQEDTPAPSTVREPHLLCCLL